MKVIGKVVVQGSIETNNLRIITLDNIGLVKIVEQRRFVVWNKSGVVISDLTYPTTKDALDAYVVIINALAGLPSQQEIYLDYDVSNTKSVNYLCLKQKLKMKTD